MTTSIRGKVAPVTGGTVGIGLATAEKLAEAGAKVVISGRYVGKGELLKPEINRGFHD